MGVLPPGQPKNMAGKLDVLAAPFGGRSGLNREDAKDPIIPVRAIRLVPVPGQLPEKAHCPIHQVAHEGTRPEHFHPLQENAVSLRTRTFLFPLQPVVDDRRVAVLAPLRQDGPEKAGNRGKNCSEPHGHRDLILSALDPGVVPAIGNN